jgi:uncharacterized protein
MNCPSCQTVLTMADRNGVEIDYCPQCRGVWLDRGELDKIIERSVAFDSRNPNPPQEARYQYEGPPRGHEAYDPDRHRRDDDDYRYDGRYDSKRNRKRSFLGDLFDFD